MTESNMLPENFTIEINEAVLQRYKLFRSVGIKLNGTLVKELPKAAIAESGKKLGILKRNTLLLETEDELSVLMDYCIYHYRRNGVNTVSRYLTLFPPAEDSLEMELLQAMRQAHYSLFQVKAANAGKGLMLWDMMRDNDIFLLDLNLSRTVQPGYLIAGHVLPMEGYYMSSGAILPITESLLKGEITRIIETFATEDGAPLSPGREAAFAGQVIRAALREHVMQKVRFADA